MVLTFGTALNRKAALTCMVTEMATRYSALALISCLLFQKSGLFVQTFSNNNGAHSVVANPKQTIAAHVAKNRSILGQIHGDTSDTLSVEMQTAAENIETVKALEFRW